MRSTCGGTAERLTRIDSSSPSPSPVRLSPVCSTEPSGLRRLLKKTKWESDTTLPFAPSIRALASRSKSAPVVVRASQPRPTMIEVRFGALLLRETFPPLVRATPMRASKLREIESSASRSPWREPGGTSWKWSAPDILRCMALRRKTGAAPAAGGRSNGAGPRGRTRPGATGRAKSDTAEAKPKRLKQMWAVFTLTRQRDPKLLPLMLAALLGPLVVGILIGLLLGGIALWTLLGLLIGLLIALNTFSRRVQKTAYAGTEGKPGAP